MTIDEFISKNHIVRFNSINGMVGEVDRIIESVFFEENITLKIIETNYVFPRIFHMSNGEQVLILDQTYWEVYGAFYYILLI